MPQYPFTNPDTFGPDGSSTLANTNTVTTNGVMDSRNPWLLPQFDPSVLTGPASNSQEANLDPTILYPTIVGKGVASGTVTVYGGAASGTVIVGGVFHAGDVLHVVVNGHATLYTVVSGDTNLQGAADSLVTALTADTTFAANFTAADSGTTTVTITAKQTGAFPGSLGNAVTLTTSVTGAANSVTLTPSGTVLASGGVGTNADVITVTTNGVAVTYTVATSNTETQMAAGLKNAFNDNVTLNANFVASNTAGVLTVAARPYPGAFYGLKGNTATFTSSVTTGTGEVVAVSGATLSGGSGVVYPVSTFTLQYNGCTLWFRKGMPRNIVDPALFALLIAVGGI